MLQISQPSLTLLYISFLLVWELTSITKLRACFLVVYGNLRLISPFLSLRSGFCASSVSSMFSIDISSGMFVCMCVCMYVLCMYVRVYVCMCVCMYVCIFF